MPKHPVPKQKQSKTRSKRRYHTFEGRVRKKLTNRIQLVKCSQCGEKRRIHHACASCGMYRGRQVLNVDKKMQKITKMQA
ncbi:50S ribosomal protein L32 [Candidatus Peregrinibacteria bacterium]|jgi:large subunit ribosomal protein L32|nr:50S ribosomal protein L32 [Candidatus Peregrinibacteria bacterium]MBT7703560.1 50S ribosomal protein L32 [Candidatus Peregrinibacteria bacterium]